MSMVRRLLLSGGLFVLGFSLLMAFHFYIKPTFLSREAVQLRVPMAMHQVLTADDLAAVRLQKEGIPQSVVTNMKELVGKKTNVNLPAGTVLTKELIDLDDLAPGAGEGLLPVPKIAVYAVNASLRAKDVVNLYLVMPEEKKQRTDQQHEVLKTDQQPEGQVFLPSVKVVSVRNEGGNMVMDGEKGNTNERLTSTDRISNVELLLKDEDAKKLRDAIMEGYMIWFFRVQ